MKAKILVVDDDPVVLVVIVQILKRAGYEVASAGTAQEAIAELKRETFQLVVSDFFLGGGTAEDVVNAISLTQPATPVLVISGNCGDIPDWLRDRHVVADIIAKPFVPEVLLSAVEKALDGPSTGGAGKTVFAKAPPALPRRVEEMVHRVVDQESIIAITDKKGTIVYANDRFCEISGYSRAELIGQNHRILKSGKHPPEFYKGLWGTILSGRTWRGEICNRSKEGRLYYVDTTIAPLRDDGLITHFLALRTDITARKEAEQALLEQGKRDEEERRMSSLGRMADGVLHDLNNILTGVMGIVSTDDSADRDEMLQNAISRMAQLTRTLRDYSTGRPTEIEPFRLNSLISCACSLARHRKGAPERLTVLDDCAATRDVEVVGNEGQIFEVVLNLLVNAIEASSSSPRPRVEVRSTMESGRASIRIMDNGPGIPAEAAASIFEPFTSTKGPGRGVGLSVSRSIVAAHGGELRLEQPGGSGRGACFCFTINARLAQTDRAPEEHGTVRMGPKRVVLVSEDEVDVRRAITHDAGQVGLTVMHAGDTADLLAMASQMKEVLAAAVLDSTEVDSDSGAVACLRRISPDLPIILISAKLASRGRRATQWGEVDSLPKPFAPDEFINALKTIA